MASRSANVRPPTHSIPDAVPPPPTATRLPPTPRRTAPVPASSSYESTGYHYHDDDHDSRATFFDTDEQPTTAAAPTAATARDSFISIVDDPFFLRYHDAVDFHGTPPVLTSVRVEGRDEPSSSQAWPPPRRESLTVSTEVPWVRRAALLLHSS